MLKHRSFWIIRNVCLLAMSIAGAVLKRQRAIAVPVQRAAQSSAALSLRHD